MNIVLVASSYLPRVGGVERVVSTLAQHLVRRGHRVTVIAPRHPRTLPAQETLDGVLVRRYFFLIPHISDLKRGRIDLFFGGLFFLPLTFLTLVFFLWRTRLDVVNLHFIGSPALFLLLAHWLLRFRFVVSLHGNDVEGLNAQSNFDRSVWRATVRGADALITPSQFLARRIADLEPTLEPRIRVVPNGVELDADADTARPDFVPRADFVLAVGRLMPVKGMDVLVDALRLCRARGISTPLVIIGDGPERDALRQLARANDLQDQIFFVGARTQPEVRQAMRACLLVVVPSRQESFGLTLLEAQDCGKAVIASNVGGIPELVCDGVTGWLVPPEDSQALAATWISALNNPTRRDEMGARAKQHALGFTASRMTDEYLVVFQSLRQNQYLKRRNKIIHE
jgi:glycosyltransferase involved in cell wall biosynthesis